MAGSLKRGYVTASLLISRLQAYPRQGQLTKLLQEYGRLIKTIFVLRYLLAFPNLNFNEQGCRFSLATP